MIDKVDKQIKSDDPFINLVITRKRKLYKFAHFDSFKNAFTFSRGDKEYSLEQALNQWFTTDKPRILEIAAGNAQFSLELARQNPKLNFMAADIKSDRLYTSAKQALSEGVTNIAFVRINMKELCHAFKPDSFAKIWLTFPDPFARKRSVRRRLTHPDFLKLYDKLLTKDGCLNFKTDSRDLFLWSLEQFVSDNWQIKQLSFDLHDSDLPADYKIMTHYEERFVEQDIPINYGTFIKN